MAAHLAFKTGTSYGFRDAWAVGFDRAGDDRGLGRARRRHAVARPQRPRHGGAGAVQDRRPVGRPGAEPAGAAAAGALLVGARATCRRGCSGSTRPCPRMPMRPAPASSTRPTGR